MDAIIVSATPIVSPPTSLDGRTILRFAHAYETGGGTERYLDDLDRALLERHALTIFRLHLTRRNPAPAPETELVGRGRLVRIPLPIRPAEDGISAEDEHSFRERARAVFRDHVLYNPVVWRLYGAKWTAGRPLAPAPDQAIGAGDTVERIIREQKVDLAMLHFFGGADAEEVILSARRHEVPVALLNHYANDRYLHLAIRKHVMLSQAAAGVNGLDVPGYVRGKFTNLSDGIDTAFFRPDHARPLANPPAQPVILLPARVIREKGQLDLVRAIAEVRRSGVDCCVAFAGRVDSSGFVDELRAEIARLGLGDRTHFLGALGLEQLRDWYAASTAVALPTYHHEGLPRVILEALAMHRPVVAYTSGGVADGIVDGNTGFLLTPGNIGGLSRRLRELLTSPALVTTMGQNGRAAAEARFSLAALAERHAKFYWKQIGESRRGSSPVSGSR